MKKTENIKMYKNKYNKRKPLSKSIFLNEITIPIEDKKLIKIIGKIKRG